MLNHGQWRRVAMCSYYRYNTEEKNYKKEENRVWIHHMDDQIQKLPVKLQKLNPHESFLYLVWKIHLNFTFSPERWSLCWPYWAAYPKKDTNLRKTIPAAKRLMLTMQLLASGDSQVSLSYLFRMEKKSEQYCEWD